MLGNPTYPTYQVFVALGLAALVTALCMPLFIRLMKHEGFGQQIRADGPSRHLVKQGTPTMGGIIMLVGIVVASCVQSSRGLSIMLAMGVMLACALLGLLDDLESVCHKRSLGLTPAQKMAGLIIICVVFCLAATNLVGISPMIELPGGFKIDLGILATTWTFGTQSITVYWLYLIFVFLLMAGLSNAVNLTDGLDGLAAGSTLVVLSLIHI